MPSRVANWSPGDAAAISSAKPPSPKSSSQWIRTCGSAILVILRKTGLCQTDQCRTEQGLGRILSSRPPVDSNSVTSGPDEVDPVLRAPLPQSRRLGFVREIVPPFEGIPPHQQLLISAVSTSSVEDVVNFVVVVGQELTSEIQG